MREVFLLIAKLFKKLYLKNSWEKQNAVNTVWKKAFVPLDYFIHVFKSNQTTIHDDETLSTGSQTGVVIPPRRPRDVNQGTQVQDLFPVINYILEDWSSTSLIILSYMLSWNFIALQGATSVKSLLRRATNHKRWKTTGLGDYLVIVSGMWLVQTQGSIIFQKN